ncbi:hypothetical protein C8R43DRAFT_365011 [Mycena crocata]|nr:hypothetical protein C8R43DRAFT_365011 [Mycena crocata]
MDSYSWDSVIQSGLESPYPIPLHWNNRSPPLHPREDKTTIKEKNTPISISATFFPTLQHRFCPHDLVLLSNDWVHFYIHSELLLNVSDNRFRAMLPVCRAEGHEPPILSIPEPSPILDIILHAIYNMPYTKYPPPFNILVKAVDSMPIYGINPKTIIRPSTSLFALFLSQAPLFPLELYTLAAHYDIIDLAVPASSHMLACPLSRLTDQVVERIGASYLKRLFLLQLDRTEALKRALSSPPRLHPPTANCNLSSQKALNRTWALMSAYLTLSARPDMSVVTLESALQPLAEHLSCEFCKQSLNDHVKNVITQWIVVKRTI